MATTLADTQADLSTNTTDTPSGSNTATPPTPQSTDPTAAGYNNPAQTVDTSQMITPTAPAATATAGQANATGQTIDPATGTVQGQLSGILAQNSPLMQQAHAAALGQMNQRGLLNSSMAVGAGQNAVIQNALPIAQQDAQAYNAAQQFSANAENQASTTNAQLNTGVSTSNAAASNQVQLTNMDQAFKTAIANETAGNQVVIQQLGDATKQTLAGIEADYKTLMQTSASASDMDRQTLDAISKVVGDAGMNAAAKTEALNGYIGWLKNGMNLVAGINGVTLGDLLNFGDTTAEPVG